MQHTLTWAYKLRFSRFITRGLQEVFLIWCENQFLRNVLLDSFTQKTRKISEIISAVVFFCGHTTYIKKECYHRFLLWTFPQKSFRATIFETLLGDFYFNGNNHVNDFVIPSERSPARRLAWTWMLPERQYWECTLLKETIW